MMVAVAVTAMGISIYPVLEEIVSIDGPYNALKRGAQRWEVGPAASVTVDISQGSIQVEPSTDGAVTAEIWCHSQTKRSQRAADWALGTIDVRMGRKGDSIEIVARSESVPGSHWRGYLKNEVIVVLHVPEGQRLDLRVPEGPIDLWGIMYRDRWRGTFGTGTIRSGTAGSHPLDAEAPDGSGHRTGTPP